MWAPGGLHRHFFSRRGRPVPCFGGGAHHRMESNATTQNDTGDSWSKLQEFDAFICPLTLEYMRDPVSTVDGHTYEREAIEEWLASNEVSPVRNLLLPSVSESSSHPTTRHRTRGCHWSPKLSFRTSLSRTRCRR